jgi:thiol-disulfide isomerase/thioredoxin
MPLLALPAASILLISAATAPPAPPKPSIPATPLVPAATRPEPPAATDAARLRIGDPAPPIEVSDWVRGEAFGGFEPGKVTVVEFWATWCGPCRTSMPHLTELQQAYEDRGVRILGISDEPREKVASFLETPEWQEKARYTLGTDPDRSSHRDYMQATGQRGIPTAFIVDAAGEVAWIGHPMVMDEPLAKIVAGEWDNDAYRERYERQKLRQAAWSARNRAYLLATRNRDWNAAMELLDAQLAEFPEDPFANLSKCRLLVIELDRGDEGILVGRRLVESPDADAMLLNQLAWSLLESGKATGPVLTLAKAAAERAVAISERKDAAVLDTLARAIWEEGDRQAAIAVQREAVAIAPDNRTGISIRKNLKEYLEAVGER